MNIFLGVTNKNWKNLAVQRRQIFHLIELKPKDLIKFWSGSSVY